MALFNFRAMSGLGLSVSDRSIECAELSVRGTTRTLRAFSRLELAEGIVVRGMVKDVAQLAEALKQAYRAAKPTGFSTNVVNLALPDIVTYFHVFTLPGSLNDAEVRDALSFQAEELIPFATRDLVTDVRVASRSAEETVALYAVAVREAVQGYLQAIDQAGLRIGRIELESEALAQWLLADRKPGTVAAVADLGAQAATVFLQDDHGLRATFSEPIAGNAITEAVLATGVKSKEDAEALKIKLGLREGKGDAKARAAIRASCQELFKRIGRIIDWHEHLVPNAPVTKLLVCGGTAELVGLPEALAESLSERHPNLQVVHAKPLASLAGTPSVRVLEKTGFGGFFASAFGAGALGRSSVPAFDFASQMKRTSLSGGKRAMSAGAGVLSYAHPTASPAKLVESKQKLIKTAHVSTPIVDMTDEEVPKDGHTLRVIGAVVFLLLAVAGLVGAFLYRQARDAEVERALAEMAAIRAQQTGAMDAPEIEPAPSEPVTEPVPPEQVPTDTSVPAEPVSPAAEPIEGTVVEPPLSTPTESPPEGVTAPSIIPEPPPSSPVIELSSTPPIVTVSTKPSVGQVQGRTLTAPVIELQEPVTVTPILKDVPITGEVELVNDAARSYSLRATTRLLSPDGTLYRLKSDVTVPAQGRLRVAVYADQPGASSSIPELTRLTLPGLPEADRALVYANADVPLIGGTQEVFILTEAQVEEALARVRLRETTNNPTALFTPLVQPDERLMPQAVWYTETHTTNVPVGTEATAVVLTVQRTPHALVVTNGALQAFVQQVFVQTSDGAPSTIELLSVEVITPPATVAEDAAQMQVLVQAAVHTP